MFLSDEGPTFKILNCTFYIGSTTTFLYFDLCFNTAYAAHYILCFSLTKAYVQNAKIYFLYRQYTNLFIFRFVFQHCLRSTLDFMFLSHEGPTFKTLDFAFYIGSTATFLYFDLYFNTAYAAHYILCFFLTMDKRSKR